MNSKIEEIEITDLDKMSSFISTHKCKSYGVADFIELIQLAKDRNESIKLLSLKEQDKIVAIAVVQFSDRRIANLHYKSMHLYGFDFYDYNCLYIKEKYETQFLKGIKKYAKRNQTQLIILENITKKLRCNHTSESIQLFDALKSTNGFDYIINKKRPKRHKKKLEDSFKYSVSHYSGSKITQELISELANLHKERWGFDNIQSAFLNERRKRDYLIHTENKVLTVIRADDSIVAVHYGILFNNSLLFHTPVLNIEYYEYSPYVNFIEVLILETAIYCKANQIDVLDFGLGDEAYKDKFSNETKEVFTYYLTVGIMSAIRFRFSIFIKKLGAKILLNFIKDTYDKLQKMRNNITVYEFSSKSNNTEQNKYFHFIENYSDFVSLYRRLKYPIKRKHYNRFRNGDMFYFLLKDNQIYCSGWSTSKDLYVTEINKIFKFDGKVILYDYHTPEQFKSKGKYEELLESIISYLNSDICTYALTNDRTLNMEIQKLGFKKSKKHQLK